MSSLAARSVSTKIARRLKKKKKRPENVYHKKRKTRRINSGYIWEAGLARVIGHDD